MNSTASAISPIHTGNFRPRSASRTKPYRVSPPAQAVRTAPAEVIAAVPPSRPDTGSHATGFVVVVLLHVVVGYAIFSGLAQKMVDIVRAPIEARLIEAVKPEAPPPPPPPVVKITPVVKQPLVPPPFVPPPEVQVAAQPPAPTIVAVTPEPPPAPINFTPSPPPAPAVVAAPEPVAISVACPTMVPPVMPRRAEQDGIGGVVKARATIREGRVIDVQILSSTPRGVFDAAVRTAMSQYGCQTNGASEIVAVQTFKFRSAQ